MNNELELMYTAFLNNSVPIKWEKFAYPSLKPLSTWAQDLALRLEFFTSWLCYGFPSSFWLSGFFFPQGKSVLHITHLLH